MSQLTERIGGKLRVLTVIEAHKALPPSLWLQEKHLLDFVGPLTEKSSTGQKEGFPLFLSAVVIFSADLKSFLSHSLNMHFPITRSLIAFLKKKVIFLC
jgi:hypothetical protein